MPLISRIRSLLSREGGFTMVTVMGVLMVGGTLAVGAFAAANGDISTSRKDQDRKQALSAAEAGIAFYLFHLNQDGNYWTKCASVPPPDPAKPSIKAPVNMPGASPMVYRSLPGSKAQYAIELLRSGAGTTCTAGATASAYMLDPATGTFKVRSTGKVNGIKRSMIATFKRRGFLDYLYFTDYETLDPAVYQSDYQQSWATSHCLVYRWAVNTGSNKYTRPGCTEIQFASDDAVNGPLHSNDMLLTCGTPTFGRPGKADSVETNAPKSSGGYTKVSGCSGSPDFQGIWTTDAPYLKPPPTNGDLMNVAADGGLLLPEGPMELQLQGSTLRYRPAARGAAWTTAAWPANGVIYAQNTTRNTWPYGCNNNGFVYNQDYSKSQVDNGCGDVWVSGTYSKDLTIAAANDVVIQGNITQDAATPDATLGLIANNFVRVYHPVTNACNNSSGARMGPYLTDPRIDAAILALNHSFIVDNWYCGPNANLGTLHVNGAIAQEFRGPVGTSGGYGGPTGYIKDYNYRDSLKFHDPPSFLDPVQSSWRIARETEQVPAGG